MDEQIRVTLMAAKYIRGERQTLMRMIEQSDYFGQFIRDIGYMKITQWLAYLSPKFIRDNIEQIIDIGIGHTSIPLIDKLSYWRVYGKYNECHPLRDDIVRDVATITAFNDDDLAALAENIWLSFDAAACIKELCPNFSLSDHRRTVLNVGFGALPEIIPGDAEPGSSSVGYIYRTVCRPDRGADASYMASYVYNVHVRDHGIANLIDAYGLTSHVNLYGPDILFDAYMRIRGPNIGPLVVAVAPLEWWRQQLDSSDICDGHKAVMMVCYFINARVSVSEILDNMTGTLVERYVRLWLQYYNCHTQYIRLLAYAIARHWLRKTRK